VVTPRGLAGDAHAATLVGNLYVQSGPLPPNYAEAASWFRRGAEAGDKAAARAWPRSISPGQASSMIRPRRPDGCASPPQGGDQAAQADLANLVLEAMVQQKT